MKLAGQVAVITGGANGVGAATALRFVREGARVMIGDLNEANAQRVLATAAEAGYGAQIDFIRIDVADEAQGTGGCIVSTASVAGYAAGSAAHAYSVAKAAVINLTRSVAVELASHRIRVNAVARGPLMTELFHRGRMEQAAETILQRQSWPVPGGASDVAGVVAFLASDDASFITGETVVVDGGLLARGPALFGEGANSALLRAAGVDKGTTGQASEQRPKPGS